MMLKLWRADTEKAKAILVSCPNGGFPEADADGHKIFENTHFETEKEAWDKIGSELTSCIEVFTEKKDELEKELREYQRRLSDCREKYQEYKAKRLYNELEKFLVALVEKCKPTPPPKSVFLGYDAPIPPYPWELKEEE